VSYDVFFQGFLAGESSGQGSAQMRDALAPHVITSTGSTLHIRYGDGAADIFISEDGMMANHISGRDPWQLLVTGAQAANWVILPLDRPVCLTAPDQRDDLPDELADNVVFVASGDDLLRVVTGG